MPVSFHPASHQANKYNIERLQNRDYVTQILQGACPKQYVETQEILQSSFSAADTSRVIFPQSSGFVKTIVQAYNTHQALIIRPDDVWLAILTQFNAFVNANAEQLRSCFVAHEGKKELVVRAVGNRYTVDFGWMSRQMGNLLAEEVVDKTLAEWIVPDFSTTTVTDKTVGCMIMMATLKAYFSYTFELSCGIPRVTLEGVKEDWEKLRSKADKLKEYGIECIAWYHLLVPVLDAFVRAFDEPDGSDNIEFWQRIAHVQNNGSGPTYLSGWITAFCVFDEGGVWMRKKLRELPELKGEAPLMSAKDFWSTFEGPAYNAVEHNSWDDLRNRKLTINDTTYHSINMSKIPANFADVDVKLNDNDKLFDCMIVAGVVGTEVNSSGDTELSAEGKYDTLRPVIGWWMSIKRPEGEVEREEREKAAREMEELEALLARISSGNSNKDEKAGNSM